MQRGNYNNFHYFSQKTRNSLFPQCKTSIGNNTGSVKDRVVKFAYSMGFSEISDRMVWPPSLSRDRKWPRTPIQRKKTFGMRVTAVAYKLEQSIMGQKMCFSDIYVLFGVRIKFFNNFHYFSQKTRNSLFPQCRTSIGNNSGSIKDRVAKFAYIMGFSTTPDRMV